MLTAHMAVSGEYRFQVRKASGEIRLDTGFFPNLITNQGLDNLAAGNTVGAFRYMSVGTGTTMPLVTDTQLVARKATIDIVSSGNTTSSIDTTNNYLILTITGSFLNGVAAGNITEVGLGPGGSGLLLTSRALVKDTGGLPTTIAVLSDEDLVVIYRFKIKIPTIDYTGSVSGHSYVLRACKTSTLSQVEGWNTSSYNAHFRLTDSTGYWKYSSTGVLGVLTGGITSPSNGLGGNLTVTHAEYIVGSYTYTGFITINTTNNDITYKAIEVPMGCSRWQIEFTPTITKLNIQTLRLGFSITVGRE